MGPSGSLPGLGVSPFFLAPHVTFYEPTLRLRPGNQRWGWVRAVLMLLFLLSRKGEILASRKDFRMNTCTPHASGALMLELAGLSPTQCFQARHQAGAPGSATGAGLGWGSPLTFPQPLQRPSGRGCGSRRVPVLFAAPPYICGEALHSCPFSIPVPFRSLGRAR